METALSKECLFHYYGQGLQFRWGNLHITTLDSFLTLYHDNTCLQARAVLAFILLLSM
jgi:hypothetical protein